MTQQRAMRHWQVRYLDLSVIAPGRTAGSACRWAFRKWIADTSIKRIPATSTDGGWVGVKVELLEGPATTTDHPGRTR
jgi:hypothetical protein